MNEKASVLTRLQWEQSNVEKDLKQAQHNQQRLQNRIDYLEKGERSKRAHRLITRGAAIESILPEVKEMDEASFYALMEAVLLHPDVQMLIQFWKERDA